MSTSTTYDINVRYKLEDRATPGAAAIGTELQKTARHGRDLMSTMKLVAGAAVVGFGLKAGKKWLIDYNSSLEDMKLTMSGLIGLNMGGSWATNQAKANDLIEVFKQDAVTSAGTMQDFAEFSSMIIGPVLRAKMSMQDLREVTKGGVVAAKAFGIEAGMAALDIEQAINGTLNKKDRFARALLEPMGMTTEIWNKMATETPELIGKNLVKAFNQPALLQMADAYTTTWSGITSTLKDRLQQALGQVGLPLMKLLVEEVKTMNDYFTKNPQKVKKYIKDFADGLISAFKFVKNTIQFVIEHADTLMSIAKAFVGFKMIQAGGSLLAGPLDAMAGYSRSQKAASGATTTFANKMTGAANKLAAFGTALGLAYAAARLFADWVDRKQDAKLKRGADRPQGFLGAAVGMGEHDKGSTDARVAAEAKSAGLTSGGEINEGRFLNSMRGAKGSASAESIQKQIDGLNSAWGGGGGKGNATFRDLLQQQEGYQGDGRSVEAYDRLVAVLEAASKEHSRVLRELVDSNKGYVNLHGGLLNYMMSGALAQDIGRAQMFNVTDDDFVGPTGTGTYNKPPEDRATKKNGDVNIHINTIKVSADDPDRFAVRMIGVFRNANTRPVSSRLRLPGGRPG